GGSPWCRDAGVVIHPGAWVEAQAAVRGVGVVDLRVPGGPGVGADCMDEHRIDRVDRDTNLRLGVRGDEIHEDVGREALTSVRGPGEPDVLVSASTVDPSDRDVVPAV